MSDARVEIVAYDPAWPLRYQEQRLRVAALVADPRAR